MPDQNQAAAWSIRLLPDQNQAADWSIRHMPDQNQVEAWSIRLLPDQNQACLILGKPLSLINPAQANQAIRQTKEICEKSSCGCLHGSSDFTPSAYGWNFSVCLLCIKVVIFLGSLRQFCGNFRNGTVKSEILHLDNFIHRVIIWIHFWCRSYFRPLGGSEAQAYFSAIFNNVSLFHGYKWFHLLNNRPSWLFKCQAFLMRP